MLESLIYYTSHGNKIFSAVGDEFSAKFLIENGANVSLTTSPNNRTALHMTAACEPEMADERKMLMSHISQCLLQHAASINAQDADGK